MKKNTLYTVFCLIVMAGAAVWIGVGLNRRAQSEQSRAAEERRDSSRNATSSMQQSGDSIPLTSLAFETKVVDFGHVSDDTLLVATFVARNVGEADLVVYYVNPDCSCTGYELSKPITQPGDTLSITLRLDTAHKMGEQKLYTIVRANTEEQMYRLLLKADVEAI